ncbi:hypothetical protein BT63DRAFT_378591 [Microthyrium microscopicum]|uniref:Putative gamma-glutamylcyclotransferase n=1 Tax=Microthyrium microscopicum TaxID=703497 RepID=A0A6A6U262_9PEZI|nr:hypothetical protein BT63DRAFT_378591 [Microthyrium microscopicum]
MLSYSAAAPEDYTPSYFFFYGSLMDPEVLQHILKLPELPLLQPATIKDFKIKMWSIYPALVPSPKGTVTGKIWKVETLEHFEKLAAYETAAYTTCPLGIHRSDTGVIEDGKAFCWKGDPISLDLEDGIFDFARYQQHFKPSLLGRGRNT